MPKLMLLGARQFLDMPKGTFYIQHWERSEKDCLSVVERFKQDPLSLIDFHNLEIYGNNSGSMSFTSKEEDFIFYYDANVVGDAFPQNTVYLVLDDSFIPELVEYTMETTWYDGNGNSGIADEALKLTREQVFNARTEFLTYFDNLDNTTDKDNDWARNWLDSNTENAEIYNLRLECEVDRPTRTADGGINRYG